MAKVTEYSRVTTLKDNDIFLVDGPDGTRTILKRNAAKDLGGEVVAVTKSGIKDKVTLNLTDNPIDLATENDLNEVADALLPIGTASGNPAVVTDAKGGTAFRELKVTIEPVQAGSGDASQDNVREISGWTSASIHVSPDTGSTGGQTYSVTLPDEAGTVYSGILDLTAGTLTVTHVMAEIGTDASSIVWELRSGEPLSVKYVTPRPAMSKGGATAGVISDQYATVVASSSTTDKAIRLLSGAIRIYDNDRFPDEATALASLAANPVHVVYMLNKPIVYQLASQQIAALMGANAVSADCGPVELAYVKDVKIQEMIAEESDGTAARAFTVGEYVIIGDKLYEVTADVSAGAELIPGTNVEETTVGEELAKSREEVSELKTQLDNTNNFIEYLNNISDSGNTSGIELGGRKSTSRIYSAPIKTLGNSITIATSDSALQFALANGDASSVISAWRSPSTISTKDQWTNGLSLWIQRIDKSAISDADIAGIINSFSVTYNVKTVKDQVLTTADIAYVSTSGSDSADGSAATPFATVNAALEKGYKNILINGGVYKQKIDLSKRRGAITLSAVGRATPIFKDPDTVEITSATQYSGNVYIADADADIFNNISWIFQDSVEDVSTEINYAERLPEQRGRLYRCTDTKIVRCTAESFSEAITEIQGASDYRFYYDDTNDKLYFSAPSSDFTTYPVCCGSGSVGLFENGTRENSIHIVGIECKYIRLNLDYTSDSIAEYCKVSCAYAPTLGQYTWDEAVNAKFLSCEAALSAGNKSTSDGDGFNAHYATDTGDKFSHISGAEFVNCWAHDNRDDGYSEHQRSESTIIGGLYEYNGKGGVTPANGCHCECISVVSRYNYNGFVCCNGANAQEGGVGTQLLCIDCTAYGNNGGGTGHGFDCFSAASDYTHNTMTCINCRAYNNLRCGYSIGHNAEQTFDYGKLVDCKASNNGVSAYRSYGSIEIITNTDVVSV